MSVKKKKVESLTSTPHTNLDLWYTTLVIHDYFVNEPIFQFSGMSQNGNHYCQICWHPDVGLPFLLNHEKINVCFFKPGSLWLFCYSNQNWLIHSSILTAFALVQTFIIIFLAWITAILWTNPSAQSPWSSEIQIWYIKPHPQQDKV